MKVYQALARAIADEGVSGAFTLVGQANMHLVAALDQDGRVPVRHALHEGTALGMAEGCARSSGRPSVCVVTGGAAMVNLALSLVEAVRSNTPIVVVSGRTPAAYRGSPQTFDHRALAATTGAGYEEITTPAHTLPVVRAVFQRARAERRPVVLDIGSDLQVADLPGEYDYRPAAHETPAAAFGAARGEQMRAAADRIRQARRPVIIAGSGAVESGAHAEISALGARVGALMATTLPAHGWFGEDPHNIGVIGMFSWPFALDLLRTSDCVIGIGASLNRYTMQDTGRPGQLSFQAENVVQISTGEPEPLGDDRYPGVFVRGDARATVAALLAELGQNPDGAPDDGPGATGWRTAEVTEQISRDRRDRDPAVFDVEDGLTDPRELCDLLDTLLPDECGVTIATGHSWSFPIMHLTRWRTPQLFAYHFGSIGVATAIGIGGAVGTPGRPMVVVEGDGSVLMNVHTLQTMARYRLPVLLVVLNDSAYGAELHQLAGKGIDAEVSLLPFTDIAALAETFGATAATIHSAAQFTAAVKDFLAEPRPYVLDCRVSQRVVSVPSRRLDYGKDL